MKYKVELRCNHCKKLINDTVVLDSKELADKIYRDALFNPLIGWCKDCDSKPSPKIIEIKEENDQMKIYCGMRLGKREDLPPVKVTVNGKSLKHQIYHSPDGFNWGYGGSGPADLARSILWDHLGKEPSHSLYNDFKEQFVSGWKDEWKITSEEIQNWLDKRGKMIK